MTTTPRRLPELHLVRLRADDRRPPRPLESAHDPYVAKALGLMQAEPTRRHTVTSLARRVGLSRPAFARRFVAVVGEPPLRHLHRIRMERAAERLTETDDGLAAVADAIGYASEYAFNRAFKRHFGTPPGRFRRGARLGSARDVVTTSATNLRDTGSPRAFARAA